LNNKHIPGGPLFIYSIQYSKMSTKLNILVPVKRVIDFAIKPRINKTNTGIEKTGVKFSINPFCDIAVSINK